MRGVGTGGPRRTLLYAALAAFVACVWLNQSVGGPDWEALRDQVFSAPADHPLQAARYPFVFLYRRSLDERYYFETAGAILGQPADLAVLRQMHGKLPSGLEESLPPADGRWHAPYVEVPMEYPPLDLPFFVLPRALVSTFAGFGYLFGGLMGLCLLGGAAAAIGAARRAGATKEDIQRKWLLASALFLAQGALAIQRLDAIVALFFGLAMLAAAARRPLGVGVAFGLAGAAKILPVLALPALVAADRPARRGPLARTALGSVVGLAVGFGPFAMAPRAIGRMLQYHANRGLHAEATLGILLGVARRIMGDARGAPVSFGSQNLEGGAADLFARLSTPLLVVASAVTVATIARAKARAPGDAREGAACVSLDRFGRVASAVLGATAVLWLTNKVLSPQYLTWGIPLVLAIPGRAGARLAWTLALAMAVTQLYTRGYFDLVVAQAPVALATLAVRQALLFVLLAMAVREATANASPRAIVGTWWTKSA